MGSAMLIRTSSLTAPPAIGSPSLTQSTTGGFSPLLRSWSQRRFRAALVSPPRSPSVVQPSEEVWSTDTTTTSVPDQLRRTRSDAYLAGSGQLAKRILRAPAVVVTDAEELEMEFSGGGKGKGRKVGGGGRGDREEDVRRRIDEYYQEMIRADPSNPLLLQNYGKFLQEVEGDMGKAEECYLRAILESPHGGDGEVLSLYGKLLWEAYRDEKRAEGYFERAVQSSPDDCYVLGSYAHFLWDAEDDDEEDRKEYGEAAPVAAPMVKAF